MTQVVIDGTQKRHPFSYTLGPGPYRWVGSFDLGATIRHAQNFGDTAAAFRDAPKLEYGMGTCAHCGHAILNVQIVRIGDGKLYGVGSDCILKVSGDGDVSAVSDMERNIRRQRNDAAKARKNEKADRDFLVVEPEYNSIVAVLAKQPHPNEHFAAQGKTLADYYNFILGSGNKSYKVKHMKAAIEKAKGLK